MNLQPPSFFEVLPPPRGNESMETEIIAKWREELAKLHRENKLLREQLEVYTCPLPHLCLTPASPRHMPPLTSDLLHTEECLQSTVRLLESDKREAAKQVLELEKMLAIQKRQFHKQMETLRAQHEEAMSKVESQRQMVSVEYQSYQEDREKKVKLLVAELSLQQEKHATQLNQHASHMEEVLAKNSNLQHRLSVLDTGKKEVIGNLQKEVASVSRQLVLSRESNERMKIENNVQLCVLTEQVATHCQKVKKLEAYLGGEIPTVVSEEDGGRTWKEEREFLYSETQKKEHEMKRLQSENYLQSVRLNSMSEILSLQEVDITKHGGNDGTKMRSLLTRWREKVYTLMVQQKLWEIEEVRKKEELRRREIYLNEKVGVAEREQRILSHTLADKDAQLRLQENKTQSVELDLDEAKIAMHSLDGKLQSRSAACARMGKNIRSIAQLYTEFKTSFNQALTRLATCEHRVTFTAKRIGSLKATLGCRQALHRSMLVDAECQVTCDESGGGLGVSTISREQLQLEVETLCQERDNMIEQLRESTGAFQEQLKFVKDKYMGESEGLKGRLVEVERECASLQQDLAEVQVKLRSSEEDKENLSNMTQELDKELHQLQASLESRIDSEVSKEKRKSRAELSGMEELLNVARREHSKAILQLQQLTRKVGVGKDKAVELIDMDRARLEVELSESRTQLQSVQVERNLLLTTLRQEEGSPLLKCKHLGRPRPRTHAETSHEHKSGGRGVGGSAEQCDGGTEGHLDDQQEDIRDVLKDLHTLSASLLSLESEPRTGTRHP